MNEFSASPKAVLGVLIPICLMMFSSPAVAQLKTPDAQNGLPIKPNKTAEVSAVCLRLDEREFSQLIHATCHSELKQAVSILVSGNANGITGQQIAQVIANEFEKSYVPAVGYWRFRERDKTAIVFVLNGFPYGSYSGENWQEGFNLVKGHAPEAWFRSRD